MGCRGSRFKADGHAAARPCTPHSPTDDTRTHTNTDSSDGLPVNGKGEDGNSQTLNSNARKNLSTSEEDTRHEHLKVDGERGTKREGRDEGREGKAASVAAKEETGKESEEDGHATEEEEDIDDESRKICPGSPSFKVYFTDNLDDDNNHTTSDDGSNNMPQIVDEASHMDKPSPKDDGSNNRPHIVDKASPKDLTTEEVKKERKKRNFPKVIPRRGQAAVKNLLNIRSCCTSASSSHDRNHVLTGKTPA